MKALLSRLILPCLWTCALCKKILIIGDSMAEFSGKSMETFCKGSTVHNAGIGGTLTTDWLSEDSLGVVGSSSCGGSPDWIWVSIGGNDNFEAKCGATAETIAEKITAMVNGVKKKAPGAKILLTGYCMPNAVETFVRRLRNTSTENKLASVTNGGCTTPASFDALHASFKIVADADPTITFVDSAAACGGTATSWSPPKYFADAIHLNNKGYCRIFSQGAIQTALGCEAPLVDCEAVDCDVPGLDSNCGSPTKKSCESCCTYSTDGNGGSSPSNGLSNNSTLTVVIASVLGAALLCVGAYLMMGRFRGRHPQATSARDGYEMEGQS